MKTTIKTTLLTIAMMLTFGTVQAQIDLNKIGDKVKGKVETKISNKILTKKDEIKTENINKAKEAIPKPDLAKPLGKGGAYNYKKKYKPSVKALAADPKASDQTVEAKYNKSVAEIHAAYEQFDPEAFPYQPYYKYKELWYLHDEESEKFRNEQFTLAVVNISKQPSGVEYIFPYTAVESPTGEKVVVTNDEFFRNAWTALYIADPQSALAFHKYVQVVMFENRKFEIKYAYKLSDKQKGIVDAKTGTLLFAPSEDLYVHAQELRKEQALTLARTAMPIDYLRYYVTELFVQYETETNPIVKYIVCFKIDGIMENIFRKHKDYKSSDVVNRKIEASYTVLKDQIFDVETNVRAHFAPTVEMPKGVKIDAATAAKVNSLAKERLGDEYVKTIFLGNKWSEFKENKYPYRVMHLSIPVAIIVKRGDKYLINYYDIAKSPHGGDWNMMVKMGAGFQPVNYK